MLLTSILPISAIKVFNLRSVVADDKLDNITRLLPELDFLSDRFASVFAGLSLLLADSLLERLCDATGLASGL